MSNNINRRDLIKGAALGAMTLGVAGLASAAPVAAVAEPAASEPAASETVAMKPGIYCGQAWGFDWIEPVQVKIEVSETELLSVEIIEKELNREEPVIMESVERLMIPRMIEQQSTAVDSICGATFVSNGVKMATEDALKKALIAGGSDPAAIKAFQVEPIPEGGEEVIDVDVVVCGVGGAGSSAAMSVAEQMQAAGLPVSVLAIETAGKCGGAASLGGGPFTVNAPKYSEVYNEGNPYCEYDSLYEDWMNVYGKGTGCKPEMVKLLMDESGNTIDWLQFEHGFVFTKAMQSLPSVAWACYQQFVYCANTRNAPMDLEAEYPDYTFGPRSQAVGQYFGHMLADYQALGGKILLETTCTELLYDAAANKVTGVKAVDNISGKVYTVNAKVVITATGGFLGSTDRQAEFIQNPVYPLQGPWAVWGMYQSKGQMIKSMVDQGLATYNIDMPPCIHVKKTDGLVRKYPIYYREGVISHLQIQNTWSLNDLPLLIGNDTGNLQVGFDGKRHYNEAGMFAFWAGGGVWYTIVGSEVVDNLAKNGFPGDPGTFKSSSWVYGFGGYPNARPIPQIYEVLEEAENLGFVHKADSLEELAGILGFPVDDFIAQVERYRGYCAAGVDDEFGKAASKLVDNLQNPPYYAVTMRPLPYATTAAMDVDTDVNVLLPDGTKVGGLFSCGNDSGGVLYSNMAPYAQYGGVALSWALTSGRLAGISAVKYLQS